MSHVNRCCGLLCLALQKWSKIRSKSDICHCFLLVFISITGCLIWYEKHESIYEIIELPDPNGIPRCKFTSLRYDSRCRLLSYLVYQDVNPSTQKHMIEGIGYYHMITTRNIIVTYDSIVGYLLKAYDVVGIGYYHMWDMHMAFLVIITCISVPAIPIPHMIVTRSISVELTIYYYTKNVICISHISTIILS